MIKAERKEGLSVAFLKQTCWPGKDRTKWCRYVRFYKGVPICAKNTAAGIRHSKRIDRMLKKETEADDLVVFDADSDLCSKKDKRRMNIHAGDNCKGRAADFLHLFPTEEIS